MQAHEALELYDLYLRRFEGRSEKTIRALLRFDERLETRIIPYADMDPLGERRKLIAFLKRIGEHGAFDMHMAFHVRRYELENDQYRLRNLRLLSFANATDLKRHCIEQGDRIFFSLEPTQHEYAEWVTIALQEIEGRPHLIHGIYANDALEAASASGKHEAVIQRLLELAVASGNPWLAAKASKALGRELKPGELAKAVDTLIKTEFDQNCGFNRILNFVLTLKADDPWRKRSLKRMYDHFRSKTGAEAADLAAGLFNASRALGCQLSDAQKRRLRDILAKYGFTFPAYHELATELANVLAASHAEDARWLQKFQMKRRAFLLCAGEAMEAEKTAPDTVGAYAIFRQLYQPQSSIKQDRKFIELMASKLTKAKLPEATNEA